MNKECIAVIINIKVHSLSKTITAEGPKTGDIEISEINWFAEYKPIFLLLKRIQPIGAMELVEIIQELKVKLLRLILNRLDLIFLHLGIQMKKGKNRENSFANNRDFIGFGNQNNKRNP